MDLHRAGFVFVIIVVLALSVRVEAHPHAGAKLSVKQAKQMNQKLAERLRMLAVVDRQYELGEEIELVFAKNEAARLRCVGNPYGLQEILIGWISGDFFGMSGDLVDMRFVSDQGKIGGGGSFFPKTKGCLRQYRSTPCLVVARYDLVDGKLNMRFRVQTDPAENRRAYEEYLKIDGIALQQGGIGKC